MYRRDVYEKAGLDPDKPPETWNELIEHAKQIKEKTDKLLSNPLSYVWATDVR